jgi:hypothetical protein
MKDLIVSNISDQEAAESKNVLERVARECRVLGVTTFSFFQSEDDFYSEEINRHCYQCGEIDNFTYIGTTVASAIDKKCTKHYKCNSCEAEIDFIEKL